MAVATTPPSWFPDYWRSVLEGRRNPKDSEPIYRIQPIGDRFGRGGLTFEQESAYDMLVAMLRGWGLESLAPEVLKLLQDGRSQDQIALLIQDTEAYKRRFAGNELRRKAGLAVLSPREYLATEASYRQIMESADLPRGFYDSPSDFATWIGADVAPTEIRDRVDLALGELENAEFRSPGTLRAFGEMGITKGNLVAHFLDRERWGLTQLQRVARAARVTGYGYDEGITVDRRRAEQLAASELVPTGQLAPAIGRVATLSREFGRLGGLYGEDFGQREAEQEIFFADEEAKRKRERLAGREVGTFSGASGVGRGSLSQAPSSY